MGGQRDTSFSFLCMSGPCEVIVNKADFDFDFLDINGAVVGLVLISVLRLNSFQSCYLSSQKVNNLKCHDG